MSDRIVIYRMSSKKLLTPVNKSEPTKDWFMPDFSKHIKRVVMRKYADGEIVVDLELEQVRRESK